MLARTSGDPSRARRPSRRAPRRGPPRPPRHCRRPGTGAAEPSSPTNSSRVRSRKRVVGWLHRPIVRLRLGPVRDRSRWAVEAKAAGSSERAHPRCVSEQRTRQRTHRPPSASETGAGAVPARPPRDPTWSTGGGRDHGRRADARDPSSRASSRCSRSGRGADALVEAGDRPAPRAVLERQGEPRSRRVDLEQRPRAADHRDRPRPPRGRPRDG